MKPPIYLLQAFFTYSGLLTSVIVSAQIPNKVVENESESALKEKFIKLEKLSWEAWKNHDGKFFQDFLSDDHVEIGFSGVADKSAVVAMVSGSTCNVQSYSVDKFRVSIFGGNTALVTYYADQTTTCNGKPAPRPVWASSLYQKRGDRWLNVSYQQTQTSQ